MSKSSPLIERGLRRLGEAILIRGLLRGQRDELKYQPLPWLNTGDAERGEGTLSRLAAIERFIDEEKITPRVALDIGSHLGFFALSLAKRGWFVYAVESIKERSYLSYILSQRLRTNVVPVRLLVNAGNVDFLPGSDITLCMSVWHHWVRRYGLDEATKILSALMMKTERLLFFDAGEEEMNDSYHLPYGSQKPSDFLLAYLKRLPKVAAVVKLGEHQAISPANERKVRAQASRTLFCLKKVSA
jgi:hypothetical protein